MTRIARLARLAVGALFSLQLVAPQFAAAQAYPTKSIRLIVPFPPGGRTDIVARLVADKLSQQLGQPVVVDNRAGAGGSIGADLIAKAPPDGYTLGIATVSTHAVNPAAMVHVPYKGAGPAINDILGGQIKVMFDNLPSSLPQIKAGKLVALAVAAPKRLDVLPNVPTLGELGLKEVNDQAWYGLVAPAKTPDAIVKKLYDATVTVLRSNDIKEKFALQGATPVGNTPAEYLAQNKAEYEKMSAIVKKKGITLEN